MFCSKISLMLASALQRFLYSDLMLVFLNQVSDKLAKYLVLCCSIFCYHFTYYQCVSSGNFCPIIFLKIVELRISETFGVLSCSPLASFGCLFGRGHDALIPSLCRPSCGSATNFSSLECARCIYLTFLLHTINFMGLPCCLRCVSIIPKLFLFEDALNCYRRYKYRL
jgi:hypothetical protein